MIPAGSFDLIIFDCDGVLIDSEPIASRTLSDALAEAGLAMDQAETHRVVTGMSERQLRAFLSESGIDDHDAFFARWHEAIFAAFRTDLRIMAGIDAVLASVHCPKCVASNSSSLRLRNSLGLLHIWDHFEPHVFSAEMVARPKPAPDLVEYCLERFGARPERSIMIDDSVHGITAAQRAGVRAIGFVDPADPRPNREAVLNKAGAMAVATGANALLLEIARAADAALTLSRF